MALGVIGAMLQFSRMVATGIAALDSGIGDTALKTFNGDTYLYSVSGVGGGIVAWSLVEGGAPVRVDDQFFSSSITWQVDRSITAVTLGGEDQLVLDIDMATGLVSYDLSSDGRVGSLQETGGLVGGGDIGAVVQTPVPGGDFLTISHDDTGQIGSYRVNSDGSLSMVHMVSGRASEMQSVAAGSGQFVVMADASTNAVTAYQVNPVSGFLGQTDSHGAAEGLGLNAPTALEVVQAHGKSWVLVGGSESDSITVMELRTDGSLIPRDHLLDTLHTRFESLQDMAVVEVSGQVFVAAGGGDDGISLFTLTSNGKLVYLDSFADTLQTGLQNVQTIEMVQVGSELQIFAASQEDAGLTQLTVSLDDLGDVRQGSGVQTGTGGDDILTGGLGDTTLNGGAGDDILVAGHRTTTITGGAGADIFVMRRGSDLTTITDFQAGTDRLDLFDYFLLRNPGQLTVTPTAQGARVEYAGETVEIHSSSGGALTENQIFGAGFIGPDHIPVDFNPGSGGDGSAGVVGTITVSPDVANPALPDAEITFTPDGGQAISALADDQGRFDLDAPPGTVSGHVDILKTYSTASAQITALDALQVLRLSVGLDPTWGPAAPENLIAADITRDGTINALDALAILKIAVGQPTDTPAEWVFLDKNADLSDITRQVVEYDTGASVSMIDGVFSVDMTSILLGNLEPV